MKRIDEDMLDLYIDINKAKNRYWLSIQKILYQSDLIFFNLFNREISDAIDFNLDSYVYRNQ